MKNLIKLALVITIIVFPYKVLGDEIYLGYGLGIGESAVHSFPETKVLDVGYRQQIISTFYWNYEAGGWIDSSGDPTRSSSFFVSTGPGLELWLKPFEIRNSWGIAIISNPDSYLGAAFPQFHGELYLGVRDSSGSGIGIKYNHFSSAGVSNPNIGRDFMLLELSQKLW